MLTSSDIKSIVSKLKEQSQNEEYANERKKQAIVNRKLEKDILESKCIQNLYPEDMLKFYTKINSSKMTENSEYNNYDTGLLDVALSGCSKIYLSTHPGSLENNERILEWIRNIRYLVSTYPNEFDFAKSITKLRQDFYGMDTFYIKAPRLDVDDSDTISPERLDCLAHEAFIGLYGLNPLRKQGIPNFTYIYGAFESSPPIIEPESKKIMPWGIKTPSNDQIFYSIFENLNIYESLNESCRTDTYEIILGYFLQVLFALKAANDYCKFTHYNLHTKNVILRKHISSSIDIEYTFGDKKYWIKSPKGIIATIQEFSTSYIHINVDNKPGDFGYNNYDNIPFDHTGIYSNKSFVIGDVYKLLTHILASTYLENKVAYTNLKGMFTFFSNEPIEEVFKHQKETFFHIPHCDKTEKLNIDDFISFVLKKYDGNSIIQKKETSSMNVLRTSGTCFEKDQGYINITKKYSLYCVPKSTIQLYDYIKYYASLYSETKDKKYLSLINQTAEIFETEFTDEVNESEHQRLESISSTLSSRFILQEIPYNANILKKDSFKEVYMTYISKCVLYYNTWERLKTGIKVLEFIEKGGSMFKNLYKTYNEIYNKNKAFYEAIRFNLLRFYTFFACYNLQVENYGSILQGITRERHFELIREIIDKPEYQWYFLTANFLKSMWM
jgi:hypothetical protein